MGKSNKSKQSYSSVNKNKEKKTKEEINIVEGWDWKYLSLVIILAAVCNFLHGQHTSSLFEKQRFFSHLSTLERELSFRTEMGLYYSYYKTIAEAPSFADGLHQIIQCNITEYPETINTLRRFNLYPEVVLGAFFRMYKWYGSTFKVTIQTCYTINRGNDLSPVQSCVGMGDIANFYVYFVFCLSGFMMFFLFILATYLSGSIIGGIITVAAYFYNHGEATRVMWTPPLRESFSFPLLILQLLNVVDMLKCKTPSYKKSILLALTTTCFMLPWQFAQFVLLTQVCALFGLYMLEFMNSNRLLTILYGLIISFFLNFILQFANTLLISSFFMSAAISAIIIVHLEKLIHKLNYRMLIWAVQAVMFISMSVAIKIFTARIFMIKDDAHIFDILKSKFTDFKDFHTLLYVCAPEFDFIGWEYPYKTAMTLLLPTSVIVGVFLLAKIGASEWMYWVKGDKKLDESSSVRQIKPHVEHFYILLQTVAFALMAVMLMRLKLFLTPGLCLMASLVASRKLFGFISKEKHYVISFLILGLMSIKGYQNLSTQWAMQNEYSNPALENLVEWINANTHKDDVFAGSMPTMAAVKLSTGRPIVNHPHYEDAALRARTKRVYQVYSRKPCDHVHRSLKEMQVTFLIVENSWCVQSTRPGCSLPEIWDNEDTKNRNRTPCCTVLQARSEPFKKVFRNEVYLVLRV